MTKKKTWSGAVCLLIIENHIVFIQRSETMPTHKGQIGFIGGHKKENENPEETVLRELEEEVQISRNLFEIIEVMEVTPTVKSTKIVPVICHYKGTKEEFIKQARSNGEWSNLILAPIDYLKDNKFWSQAKVTLTNSGRTHIYFFPLLPSKCLFKDQPKKIPTLWGATGLIIFNFFKNHYLNDTTIAN